MSMKLAIMQPYFFPYIGYFQLINAVDKFIIYTKLNFIKKEWMNRNRILDSGNGSIVQIGIPLVKGGSNHKIDEVKIYNESNWQKKLKNIIISNYKKAPFFDEVYSFLEELIDVKYEYLYHFNIVSIVKICNYLGITTEISYEDTYFPLIEKKLKERQLYYKEYPEDIYPAKVLRIFEICQNEKSNIYYNAIGGMKLYDKYIFKKNNIDLHFLLTKNVVYNRKNNFFEPNLSIIDVIMFNSPIEVKVMLEEYIIL
jgi:hypothetical protein